ncbi:putative Phage integrase [Pseudomonas caricapapayae]|nr:putative Phage integrase [Pseudomonas caricapapayae]
MPTAHCTAAHGYSGSASDCNHSMPDNVTSPYLVHSRPEHLKQKQAQTKNHWTKIEERYLTRAFKAARQGAKRVGVMRKCQTSTRSRRCHRTCTRRPKSTDKRSLSMREGI